MFPGYHPYQVCEQMLGWAFDATRGFEESDLCELYCGNGCFTIALAPNFRRVVATELSKSSVETLTRTRTLTPTPT